MKNPTAVRHISIAGNLDTSRAVRMTIDEDGMTVVMSLLSNLYSNGSEAVVREYSCNARDSHVEAGQTRPIEVSLPTTLNPQLQVQDWGVGLSRDEIFNVYARYGASTKRDSNDQIGAFGIGAKSAFTVGTQFTVTGVKDGEKTIVMFSLQRQGTPMVQELFHGPTDEPNGVLVDVGVENVQAVCAAADKIFSCWKAGTVLVDGSQPKSMWDGTEKLAEEVYVDWQAAVSVYDASAHFKLVMGGVPYAIPSALWPELSPKAQSFYAATQATSIVYVLDVPIGRVDITPNREELHITPRTRSTVGRLVELAANSLDAWITSKLDSAPTIWEAAKVYTQLVAKLNYNNDPVNVYWNGLSLGSEIVQFGADLFSLGWSHSYSSEPRTIASSGYAKSIKHVGDRNELFVVNVPEDKINTVRSYAKLMLRERNKAFLVVIAEPGIKRDWFSVGHGADHEDIEFMDFKDYWEAGKALRKAQRLTAGPSSRNRTRYKTWCAGDQYQRYRTVSEIEDLGTEKVVVGRCDPNNRVHQEYMKKHDTIFVTLSSRQSLDVFKRFFPAAIVNGTELKDYAEKLIKNLSVTDRWLLKRNAQNKARDQVMTRFVISNKAAITNASVLRYAESVDKDLTFTEDELQRLNYLGDLHRVAGVRFEDGDASDDLFAKDLPLLKFTLRNSYIAKITIGNEFLMNQALIDYINNMPVAVI